MPAPSSLKRHQHCPAKDRQTVPRGAQSSAWHDLCGGGEGCRGSGDEPRPPHGGPSPAYATPP
eukprot:6214514-Pleurochrysis_carterae.AAC.4